MDAGTREDALWRLWISPVLTSLVPWFVPVLDSSNGYTWWGMLTTGLVPLVGALSALRFARRSGRRVLWPLVPYAIVAVLTCAAAVALAPLSARQLELQFTFWFDGLSALVLAGVAAGPFTSLVGGRFAFVNARTR